MNDETLWEVFQTVYEPGSRSSFAHGQQDWPEIVDGIRAVAEWARKEALERAAVTAWTAGMDPLAGLVRAREFGSEIAFKIRALNDGGNP